MDITILFPVYNEEKRLKRGILETIRFLDTYLVPAEEDFRYRLLIVDNGSTDQTEKIADRLARQYGNVDYLRIDEKGVGAAFRAGVRHNTSEIIGYMDVDLSADIRHLPSVVRLFKEHPEIMMINGSKQAEGAKIIGRKWYRNLTSKGLSFVMKKRLHMQQADAICGFKFFRKDFVERLIAEADQRENGWFFIIELLIRAERSGQKVFELPVRYTEEEGGHVNVVRQTIDYMKNIEKLRRNIL